eukprot:TRINITY_DN292_c0_g1_i1.p1 TRINITY_DN292_c0_g1~~TRINITY_DN292_c0_g1_i1.p1  ORF type:complete len:367 (+),score=111.89 TRINITY_DN292_c0_g1_i1:117-1217(+)
MKLFRSAMTSTKRSATHCGSWYPGTAPKLIRLMKPLLDDVKVVTSLPARAVIVPHAGYTYCATTAANAFKHVQPSSGIKRVFILGPSHRYPTKMCLMSSACTWESPFGDVAVDAEVMKALKSTGKFDYMDLDVDEEEHSLEMELPWIKLIMKDQSFTIVPIMVGSLSIKQEREVGAILSPYVDDVSNLFVLSSDFCHWGERFDYMYYDKTKGKIWQSIEDLDRKGMTAIESLKAENFVSYLSMYENTICGRHPITIFLHAVEKSKKTYKAKFVNYAQSSTVEGEWDSSVSYAGGVFWLDSASSSTAASSLSKTPSVSPVSTSSSSSSSSASATTSSSLSSAPVLSSTSNSSSSSSSSSTTTHSSKP